MKNTLSQKGRFFIQKAKGVPCAETEYNHLCGKNRVGLCVRVWVCMDYTGMDGMYKGKRIFVKRGVNKYIFIKGLWGSKLGGAHGSNLGSNFCYKLIAVLFINALFICMNCLYLSELHKKIIYYGQNTQM